MQPASLPSSYYQYTPPTPNWYTQTHQYQTFNHQIMSSANSPMLPPENTSQPATIECVNFLFRLRRLLTASMTARPLLCVRLRRRTANTVLRPHRTSRATASNISTPNELNWRPSSRNITLHRPSTTPRQHPHPHPLLPPQLPK